MYNGHLCQRKVPIMSRCVRFNSDVEWRRFDVTAPVHRYLFLSVKLIRFVFRSLLAWLAASSRIYHKSEGDGTAPFTELCVDGLSSLRRLAVGTDTKSQPTCKCSCKTICHVVIGYRMCCVVVKEKHRLTHRMAGCLNPYHTNVENRVSS